MGMGFHDGGGAEDFQGQFNDILNQMFPDTPSGRARRDVFVGGSGLSVKESGFQLRKNVEKGQNELKELVETVMTLQEQGHVNERANIKISDELLKVFNTLNGNGTYIKRK